MGDDAPPSLFKLSLRFLGANAHHVESLQDFPEEVGRQIWEQWERVQQVAVPPANDDDEEETESLRAQSVRLFCEAYPLCVLPSCKVPDRDFLYFRNSLVLCSFCTELDASGLGLGDRHELLRSCHAFPHLATLVLRNNGIGPKGVRNMLGPSHLERNRKSSFKYAFLILNFMFSSLIMIFIGSCPIWTSVRTRY